MDKFVLTSSLIVVGFLISWIIFLVSQRIGVSDPFAVELVAWWLLTDLLVLSKLKESWQLCFGGQWLQNYRDPVTTALVAVGIIFLLLIVWFGRKHDTGEFVVGEDWAQQSPYHYTVRGFIPRSISGAYTSLQLWMFMI
jgi:hypothetical protein